MMKERKTFQPLKSSDVFAAYKTLYDAGLVPFPTTQEAEWKVEAIVANVGASYFGKSMYESPQEKAVAYLYFLINDHPFTDGNKRTATLSFLMVCDINNLCLKADEFSLDELAVFMEQVQEDHQAVIKRFAKLLFA